MKTRKHMLTMRAILAAAMLAAAAATPPAGAAFRFTKIVEPGFDPLTGLATAVQLGGLNNLGQVAYSRLQWDQATFSDIVASVELADSLGVRLIAGPFTSEEGFLEQATVTGLTESGRVGFGLQKIDLMTGDIVAAQFLTAYRGQSVTVAHGTFYGLVNESGTVAYETIDGLEGGDRSIFTGRRSPFDHVTTDVNIYDYYFPPVALNDQHTVAYYRSSLGTDSGLYLWKDNVSTRVFDPRAHGLPHEFQVETIRPNTYLPRGFALNNEGAVAVVTWQPSILDFGWITYTGAWPSRIVRVNDGTVTTLATADGPEVFPDDNQWFYGPFDLNNAGFATWIWSGRGEEALYVGDGTRTERIIGTGDVLDGKTVTFLGQENIGYLNERGQVAFTVGFDDNSMAIMLATPVEKP